MRLFGGTVASTVYFQLAKNSFLTWRDHVGLGCGATGASSLGPRLARLLPQAAAGRYFLSLDEKLLAATSISMIDLAFYIHV